MRQWRWKVWHRLCPIWHCSLGRRTQILVPWSVTSLQDKYFKPKNHYVSSSMGLYSSRHISSTCILFLLCHAADHTESTIWSCTSVWWSRWERPPIVSKSLKIQTEASLKVLLVFPHHFPTQILLGQPHSIALSLLPLVKLLNLYLYQNGSKRQIFRYATCWIIWSISIWAQLHSLLFYDCRYHMDPSGTFVQCDARAIGSASEGAQSSLQEVYHKVRTASSSQCWLMHEFKEISCCPACISISYSNISNININIQIFDFFFLEISQVLEFEIFLCPFSFLTKQSMTLKDAIKSSLTILKQVMEEKLNATNIEVRFFHLIHLFILD